MVKANSIVTFMSPGKLYNSLHYVIPWEFVQYPLMYSNGYHELISEIEMMYENRTKILSAPLQVNVSLLWAINQQLHLRNFVLNILMCIEL